MGVLLQGPGPLGPLRKDSARASDGPTELLLDFFAL